MTGPAGFLAGLDLAAVRKELLRCCGSTAWADRLAAALPFASDAALFAAAEEEWWALEPEDWQEAFAAHPRIGEPAATGSGTAGWSRDEQAGMGGASADTREEISQANRAYEDRFGHVFLICATGRTAEEMASELRRRLANSPEGELRVAASEQARITRIRLEKLGGP